MSEVRLEDILDTTELARAVGNGLIRARRHLADPSFVIYNYSEQAQFQRAWTHEVRTCRGLIVRDGIVIARPFAKFFNASEPEAAKIDLSETVFVSDKMDGSLGILYPGPKGAAIATRGSFHSEQAQRATRMLDDLYGHDMIPMNEEWTDLFEIIYPENRIVVDYGDMEELVHLGRVELSSGVVSAASSFVTGSRARFFGYMTYLEALALQAREGREGTVIRVPGTDRMVKVKQEDYIRLHKIVTGLSQKSVWEWLRDGTFDENAAALPDEFHHWATSTAAVLSQTFAEIAEGATVALDAAQRDIGPGGTRKELALRIAAEPNRHLVFALADGKPIDALIWKQLEPKGPSPIDKEAAA